VEVSGNGLEAEGSPAGITAQWGASLSATDSVVDGNAHIGVLAYDADTTVQLTDTQVSATQPDVDGSFGYGVGVQGGAAITLTGCTVEGNTALGVLAADAASAAQLIDSTVQATVTGTGMTVGIGVVCQHEATVEISGGVVQSNEGPGIYAVTGGSVSCEGCELQDNSFAAAIVYESALQLSGATIGDTVGHPDLEGGVGIYASSTGLPSTVTVADSTIGPQPYAAVVLAGEGVYSLTGNDLSGGDGAIYPIPGGALLATDGVGTWTGTQGLLLQDNSLHDSAGIAVLLDASSATLADNSYSANNVDLVQQSCGGVPEPDGWEEAPNAEICPLSDYPIPPLSFSLYR